MLQIVRPSCLLCHPLLIYRDQEESQCFKNNTAAVCKHAQKVPDKMMQGIESNARVRHNLDSENTLLVDYWSGQAMQFVLELLLSALRW